MTNNEKWYYQHYSDSKYYGANMGPYWVLSAQEGPDVPCY